MPAPITAEVGEMLREYGRRLSLGGGNPYRVRAYVRAADSLTALGEPLEDLIVEDRPTDVPGVGDAIAAMVTTMYRKGTYPKLEEMRRELPASVLEVFAVMRATWMCAALMSLTVGTSTGGPWRT
jgi:DNA polymerase (family 10)